MKVKELLAQLEKLNPNETVIVAGDSEGNSFRELSTAEEGTYSGGYDIEVGIRELTHKLAADGFSEEDVKPVPCVVIW